MAFMRKEFAGQLQIAAAAHGHGMGDFTQQRSLAGPIRPSIP
jgi:hypothetical protein